MTGVMGEILEHYGQTVTLRSRDGEKSVRAFIQPAAARMKPCRESRRLSVG